MSNKSWVTRRMEPLATRRALIISGACFAVFAVVFFATSAPFAVPHVEAVCGAAPLDVRFHSTADDVQEFLGTCGAEGRAAYRNLQIADLVYPTIVGMFVTSALALTLKHLVPGRPNAVGWAAFAVLGSAFDYVENALAWTALATHPDVGAAGTLLGYASAAKTIASWAAGVTLLACLLLLAGRIARRRMASQRRPQPALR